MICSLIPLGNLPGKGKDSAVENTGNLDGSRAEERRGERQRTIAQERCATAALTIFALGGLEADGRMTGFSQG